MGRGLLAAVAWCGRLLVVALMLLFLLVAYLHVVGVPSVWLDSLRERAAEEGYFLEVDKVRLAIDGGLVASGVKLYAREDDPVPLVTAKSLSAAVSVVDWVLGRRMAPTLELLGGKVAIPVGAGGDYGSRTTVPVEDIRVRFTLQEGEMVLREFKARMLGMRFGGRGAIYLGESEDGGEGVDRPVETVMEALEQVPDELVRLVKMFQQMKFAEEPTAAFTFTFYPEHPEANAWAADLSAGAGRLGAVDWTSFALAARWREGRLSLEQLRLGVGGDGDEALEASGWFEPGSGEAFAKATSTLRPLSMAKALPPEWVAEATNWVDTLDFPLRLEAAAGPGPAAGLATQAFAKVTARGVSLRGLEVPVLTLDIRQVDGATEIPSGHFKVSDGTLAGEADIRNLRIDERTWDYGLDLDGKLVPTWLDRFLSEEEWPGVKNVLGRFVFRSTPSMTLRIDGRGDDPNVTVQGPCTVTDFDVHGVAVDRATAGLLVSNGVVHLRRLQASRGETEARGNVDIDLDRQTVRFKAESTLQLGESGGMLGPEVGEFLGRFRFEGPTTAKAEGVLDYCSFALNDLSGHLEADRAGAGAWLADAVSFDVRVKGLDIELSNVTADGFGGHASGSARFYPVGRDSHWRYEAVVEAEEVQLDQVLAAALGPDSTNDLRGSVTGGGHLSGYLDDTWAETMRGRGKVALRDGWIFQVPLFDGLTTVLKLAAPDFSFFAQTDATASFEIADGRLRTPDAAIEGSLFSVAGDGSYGLADGTLDFDVEVQLLRGGFFAKLVRIVTSPVTSLLKFNLSGTPSDAKWRPTNLNPAKLLDLASDGVSSLAGVVGLGGDDGTDEEGAVRPVAPLPVPDAPTTEAE